ncbi:hypothetical protein RHSIM_Rhsim13G0049600 [Rhododendron simsii]|uniref:Cytochrome P450 n=1 Tax=Rhododendron simsii TaxID=118357 RepID=A0A834G6Q2_RHOSS|nr:hypothetical protein RHSIM_Rhsim13G0049600 [Rhododendron simsii]
MDSLTHFFSILGLLALLLHFYFKRIIPNSSEASKSRRVRAPQPSGALPLIGHLHLLRGKVPLARTLGAMADKHGPILSVRLGSHRALVVSSWEFVKECFTTNDAIFASRPVLAVSKYLGYDQAVFALVPYGPYWREVRKIVTLELLTNRRLEQLKHVRESEVDFCTMDLHLLCRKNGDSPTRVAMNEWFGYLTGNIIMRMLAGKRFSASTCDNSDTEEGHLKEAIRKAVYLSGIFVVSDAIPWLEWVDIGGHVKSMKQTYKEIDAVLGRWLQEHVQKSMEISDNINGDEADFIDVMLSVLAEDTPMFGHKRDDVIKATTMV